MKLLDVAKASLQELAGDFEAFILDSGEVPWSEHDAKFGKVKAFAFEPFKEREDLRHAYGLHLQRMRKRFAPALENENSLVAANAILVTIDRASSLLHRQMEKLGEEFRSKGGFTEHLSNVRLAARNKEQEESDTPVCPKCGGPMRKVIARKGGNAGNPFWSCRAYPNCDGTLRWNYKG